MNRLEATMRKQRKLKEYQKIIDAKLSFFQVDKMPVQQPGVLLYHELIQLPKHIEKIK